MCKDNRIYMQLQHLNRRKHMMGNDLKIIKGILKLMSPTHSEYNQYKSDLYVSRQALNEIRFEFRKKTRKLIYLHYVMSINFPQEPNSLFDFCMLIEDPLFNSDNFYLF